MLNVGASIGGSSTGLYIYIGMWNFDRDGHQCDLTIYNPGRKKQE